MRDEGILEIGGKREAGAKEKERGKGERREGGRPSLPLPRGAAVELRLAAGVFAMVRGGSEIGEDRRGVWVGEPSSGHGRATVARPFGRRGRGDRKRGGSCGEHNGGEGYTDGGGFSQETAEEAC